MVNRASNKIQIGGEIHGVIIPHGVHQIHVSQPQSHLIMAIAWVRDSYPIRFRHMGKRGPLRRGGEEHVPLWNPNLSATQALLRAENRLFVSPLSSPFDEEKERERAKESKADEEAIERCFCSTFGPLAFGVPLGFLRQIRSSNRRAWRERTGSEAPPEGEDCDCDYAIANGIRFGLWCRVFSLTGDGETDGRHGSGGGGGDDDGDDASASARSHCGMRF